MSAAKELKASLRKKLEPMFQQLEREYNEGKKESIIAAVAFSLWCDAEVPRWANHAFVEAYFHKPRSWDDVFGRPRPKGARIDPGRPETVRRLFSRVRKLRDRGVGLEAALRQVGKAFGLSYSKARAIWYDPKARYSYTIYWSSSRTAKKMRDDLGPEPDAESIAVWFKENDAFVQETMVPVIELFPNGSEDK